MYELEYFKCDEFSNPDILVSVTGSISSGIHLRRSIIADEYAVSHKIKYTEHLGPLGAQFSIDFSGPVKISVNGVVSRSRHVLYVNLVEPILRFLMISKGYVLLHAACVDTEGRGILLSAPPDTGKTSTVLRCVRENKFSFLADDMTIISLPNNAICFPKAMTISAHTLRTAANVSNGHLARWLWLRSKVHSEGGRGFMRRLGTHNVPIFTINAVGQTIIRPPKFKIEDVLQQVNILERTRVEKLYFLQREGEGISKIPAETAVTRAIENSDDAFLFPPYREMLNYINIGGKSAGRLLEEERDMLTKFLTSIDSFILKSETRSWYN
ncbi:MAG: hypothetical protein ACRD5H_15290, partial [Nitrososphaerales archaeon]